MKIEDATGKQMEAMSVFSHSIRYLKDDVIFEVNKTQVHSLNNLDIHWVLSIPTIWNDAAKLFIKEAAEQVKLSVI